MTNSRIPDERQFLTSDNTGVSLDVGNYCTVSLFFNQAQLLYSGSKCDKSGKYYICLVSCFATAASSTSLSDAVPDQPACPDIYLKYGLVQFPAFAADDGSATPYVTLRPSSR